MLLLSDKELAYKYKEFIFHHENIVIFSPYIKLNALKYICHDNEKRISSIITSWKPIDIVSQATDLSVYDYAKENGITLYVNNEIHLKVIADMQFNSCILSSANITNRGLSLSDKHSWELGTIVEKIDEETRHYLHNIIVKSFVVHDEYYNSIINEIQKFPPVEKIPPAFKTPFPKKKYTLNDLPYFDNPSRLFNIGKTTFVSEGNEFRNAFHDLHLYNCILCNDETEFFNKMKLEFQNHYFIRELINFIGEGQRFGAISSWLHNTLQDDPAPPRKIIKEFQQRIFAYIRYFMSDEFQITRPSHSEYITRITSAGRE